MSQTIITKAFEQLKAQQAANGSIVMLDEFVFANVPDLNITDPIDRNESFPDASQIVHRQAVSKTGMVNANAVVYSVALGADTGDFDFNWVGLVHTDSNTVAMIVHAPLQKKIKTANGQQGNVLTRSFLMEYDGASQQTQIITPADTWQIDFTARLNAIDERIRKENIDIWGAAGFFGDAFLVSLSGSNYTVNKGVGYVAGLRAELIADQTVAISSKPSKVWVDVCWRGTLSSTWDTSTRVTVAEEMADYREDDEQHYVFAVAQINADGSVIDLRSGNNSQGLGVIDALNGKQPLSDLLTAFAALNGEKDMLPYFADEKTLALSAVTASARELLGQKSAADVLVWLALNRIVQAEESTRILSPVGTYLTIRDEEWGAFSNENKPIALPVAAGGTGGNTPEEAREKLGLNNAYGLKKWVSPGQTLVTNTPTVVNHGLSNIDLDLCRLDIRLRCVVANNGYVPGEYCVGFSPRMQAGDTGSHSGTLGAILTTTTVQWNTGQAGIVITPKLTGVGVGLNSVSAFAQWALEFVVVYQ